MVFEASSLVKKSLVKSSNLPPESIPTQEHRKRQAIIEKKRLKYFFIKIYLKKVFIKLYERIINIIYLKA